VVDYLGESADSAVALNFQSRDYRKLFGTEIAESQRLQARGFSSAAYDNVDGLVSHCA